MPPDAPWGSAGAIFAGGSAALGGAGNLPAAAGIGSFATASIGFRAGAGGGAAGKRLSVTSRRN
jgi:hypothetical protein